MTTTQRLESKFWTPQVIRDTGVPPQVQLALTYLLTIIAMSGVNGKANQPDAFMQPYRKE